jgi:hexokinase
VSSAKDFLNRYGMNPELVDPGVYSRLIAEDMMRGLEGKKSFMPMIPTYLSNSGNVPKNKPVVVIDAGGTNFRCALLTFTDQGYELEGLQKALMPGIEKPASWNEFISFTADHILPFMDKTDKIGFCFSYSADITPEIDGKVNRIDKEVVIQDSEGMLVGKSLSDELARRGFPGKRVIVLNDTAAVLLGGSASLNKSQYSGFIGQVSGTGTNTCCLISMDRIRKLGRTDESRIIVNMEAGLYAGIRQGVFDRLLDQESHNPGVKIFEKQTAGVYLGELVRLMVGQAAEDGLIEKETKEKVYGLGKINSAVIDNWAGGDSLDTLCSAEEDRSFLREISLSMFDRSARCMCSNLLGIALFTGDGELNGKPLCVCAEGSLVQKSRFYRPFLEKYLAEYASLLGKQIELRIGNESTLSGSAAAALLNS